MVNNDFGISYSNDLPRLGSASEGMRVISESWSASRDALTIDLAGRRGAHYELETWNPSQIQSVDGAELRNHKLIVTIPSNRSEDYARATIAVHFRASRAR
jgi:hypothetical protein